MIGKYGLILALLLVGGCAQEIDRDELRTALIDLHQEYYNDTLPRWNDVPEWSGQDQHCPPCPDTATGDWYLRLELEGSNTKIRIRLDTLWAVADCVWIKREPTLYLKGED